MRIQNVPNTFQPKYTSTYPGYSAGKNMEEIFYDYYINTHTTTSVQSSYVYLPVFWTSYYISHGYGQHIDELYDWLDTLDKTKKYFTIVQNASGIYVKNFDLQLTVFSAGGGGLNINNHQTVHEIHFHGFTRSCFFGVKGDYDIPLLCLPSLPMNNITRDIFCSFMGRYDTHKCRMDMKHILSPVIYNNKYQYMESSDHKTYCNILNRSIFTLAPRGYG